MSELDDGKVEIHGKIYKTVALRVQEFRDDHPEWSISTKVLGSADLVQIRATIRDHDGRVVSTGTAEEERGRTTILKTSAMETCETSAVGRALAFLAYGGTDIRSADEMANAVVQQKESQLVERLQAHNTAVRDNIESITAIKAYLLNDDYSAAYEATAEIHEEDKRSLWIAPSNGGIWTTREREQMKSNEWTQARQDHHNGDEAA